jgi:hypothetical protein
MGFFNNWLSGGAEKPQEMNANEQPQAEMEVAHSNTENINPENPSEPGDQYDSGVKFEDLDENYDTLESLDRDIENLGKEEKDAA